MKKLNLVLPVVLILTACGSSPTSPTAPPSVPPSAPATITVTGHVSATNGGQALSGLSMQLGSVTTTTDGSGVFSASMLPAANVMLALTGSGIVPRTIRIAANSSRDVNADAIALGGGFDLNFYRQLVRNANEGGMEPLRRWTTAPSLYIQATTLVSAGTLDMVERTARDVVPTWTAGAFTVIAVERGSDTRENQAGWITVKWSTTTDHCGIADVGKSGGVVTFNPNRCACGGTFAPTAVRHELGHAMGFWHTDASTDVMFASFQCDLQPSARERYHAAIAYQRPVGNVDPDQDPSGVVSLAPLRVQ